MKSCRKQWIEEKKSYLSGRFLMIRSEVFLSACFLGLFCACASDAGHPPVARLSIEPRYVPVNVKTLVILDGRSSCDELDHPEGCDKTGDGSGPEKSCPGGVTFQWDINEPVEVVEGGPEESLMKVNVTTDRPIRVILRVKDCDGNTAEVRGRIGVILSWPDASHE